MKKHYAIGVDVGGTNIKFALIDSQGKIFDYYEISTDSHMGREKIVQNIITGIKYILNNNKRIKISGIGVGTPGLVDDKGKVVTGAANLKGWNGTEIGKILRNELKMKTVVDNDVTALALGEVLFGVGKGYNNAICLAFGTGLGGGIIIDKKVYRGKFGYAGEFGHIVVNPDGPLCSCGNRGCLETYASTVGLKRLAKEHLNKNDNSLLLKMANGNSKNITPEIIFEAYKQNDKIAEKILNEMGYYLGIGIGSLVNIFDPDIIILAGGISNAGKTLTDLIYKYLYNHTLAFFKNRVKLKISKLKHKSGVIGSASLVFERMVNEKE